MAYNNSSNQNNQSGGMGFLGFLTLLFIGLKLGGVIAWSWWWVFAPVWGVVLLLLVVALIAGLVASSR